MTGPSLHTDHPVDALPDFVRGRASDAAEIQHHLHGCESCREEVALLRALAGTAAAMTAEESARVWSGLAAARVATVEASPEAGRRSTWLSVAWKVAAGFALLFTSVGVWRIVQTGSTPEWNPDAALDGWAEEVADVELSRGELRLVLGTGLLDDIALDEGWTMGLSPGDVDELTVPWEEER
ncbi:MAG: zf-HC2 domain-containing protein [Gemmatimonadota bacterium]|nr:zf-HC2 domain-containing protein [Gemmatimonadota bacterium]